MDLPVDYNSISQQDRRLVREEYIIRQNGKCQHCGTPLDGPPDSFVTDHDVDRGLFPPSFFNWPVHLHHDHKTGMTIGVVHCYCNAVLWQYHGE